MEKHYIFQSYRSIYKDVFEGYELEIHVVDHCNLKCAGCNHFSPLAEPNFITVQDFVENLTLVAEKLPTIKTLLLLGGEPLLHPNLLELCQVARKILPNTTIAVLTNGIILNKWEEQDLNPYLNVSNFGFLVSEYYGMDYARVHEYMQDDRYSHLFTEKNVTRFLFSSDLVNLEGSEDAEHNFFNCSKHKLPCFTLKNKKIYICPFSAHIEHFCKKFNKNIPDPPENYIDLTKKVSLQDLQDFCFKSKPICKYCKEGDPNIWDYANYQIDDYTKTNKELFLTNYGLYQKKVNNINFYNMINHEQYSKIDLNFYPQMTNLLETRFKTGKIDIIIPFYKIKKSKFDKCLNGLLQQTIINDCTIYFVSDNSPDEEYVYDLVQDLQLNAVFLKTEIQSGPGVARNLGLKNSFAPFVFFLDSDDYFIKENNLEYLYNIISNSEYNIIYAKEYNESDDAISDQGHNRLYRRSFLELNDIHFGPLFINEDCYFDNLILHCSQTKEHKIDFVGYFYSKNNTPINEDQKQLLVNGIYSDFLSYIDLRAKNVPMEDLTFLIEKLSDGSWLYRKERLADRPIDELEEFLLNSFYVTVLLCKDMEVKNYILNLSTNNEIYNFIKESILTDNYSLMLNGTEFSTNKDSFMLNMKNRILANDSYKKILPEGKRKILQYADEGL